MYNSYKEFILFLVGVNGLFKPFVTKQKRMYNSYKEFILFLVGVNGLFKPFLERITISYMEKNAL
ncbi:Uncharacterised protein [Helicobacter acinonychis]|nr:Uncharacterised protein [Helicobacter acinonychis]